MKEGQAIIYIKEVTDQCGEGEKDHANGNQNRTERPEICRQGLLYIGSPGSLFGNGHTRTKAHHCRSRADYQGIQVYGKHLYKPLFYGMADIGCSGSIRGRTDTGFVRVEAALYAVHEARSGNTAENSLKVKCISKDNCKHIGDIRNMGQNNI